MEKIRLLQAIEQEVTILHELSARTEQETQAGLRQHLDLLKEALRQTFLPVGVTEQTLASGLVLRGRSLTITLLPERLDDLRYWVLRAQGSLQRASRVQIVPPVGLRPEPALQIAPRGGRRERLHLQRQLSYHRLLVNRLRNWLSRPAHTGWHYRLVLAAEPSAQYFGRRERSGQRLEGTPYHTPEDLIRAWMA